MTMSFVHQGEQIQLKGDSVLVIEVPQVAALKVQKWLKGNEVWVFVLLEPVPEPVEIVESEPLNE
jgi:hypothetical protein